MNPFTEDLRYDYDLTPDSLVIDAGAHLGNFSRAMGKKFDCHIFGFEPIGKFWREAIQGQTDKTKIVPCGLGAWSRVEKFKIKGDSSGLFAESEEEESAWILPVTQLSCFSRIDLLKLNIEGAEYEVLEKILLLRMATHFDNLQIQFHTNAPDYVDRRNSIHEQLWQTHHLTYDYPFVWENWKKNESQ